MTETDKKLKELEKSIVRTDYRKDKNGWVSFNVNKPKVKLRKYITGLAQKLSNTNDKGFRINRDLLIEYYNKDGLKGVHRE